jgi:hypothetical protein
LCDAVGAVKSLQTRRFAGTYADLLAGGRFAAPTRFFLDELYGDKDYAERDAQFVRIAPAIERVFPAAAAQTAVALAQLHALTEELDHAIGRAWLDLVQAPGEPARYIEAWRNVGCRAERSSQVRAVLAIGEDMIRLTRTPGLRMMLRVMRAPAAAAGLAALQRFLEAGFDTFAALARAGHAPAFLRTIADRESALIDQLFDAPAVACETELARTLGQAP